MSKMNFCTKEMFNITNNTEFEKLCFNIFNYQYKFNVVYKNYVNNLKVDISKVAEIKDIPFIPIDFYKTHKIITNATTIETTFRSSGTTGTNISEHHILDLSIYEKSFLKTFNQFYGNPENFTFLALLPSYSERNDSSLIYMVQKFMEISKKKDAGFFLYNFDELYKKIYELEKRNDKTILFGVSFALLDFFEKYQIKLKNTIIIETGGMKGRKKEIVREELHSKIKRATNLEAIHSEYGMTELLSQAYAKKQNRYQTPPWMKVLIRDVNDPFTYVKHGATGGVNIIDLANINSCSFVETKDLGKLHYDNSFEVLGRFDNSDIRGCNLMVI